MEFYSKPNLSTKISYFLNIEYPLSLHTEHQPYKPVLFVQLMPNIGSSEAKPVYALLVLEPTECSTSTRQRVYIYIYIYNVYI